MFVIKNAVKMQKYLKVEWEDGLMANFNYLWLHDNSERRPNMCYMNIETKPESIEVLKNSLNVVWPLYLQTKYSSKFLRKNAFIDNNFFDTNREQTASTSKYAFETFQEPNKNIINHFSNEFNTITIGKSENNNHIWSIVEANFINSRFVTGQTFWGSTKVQEPGTIWPHIQKIPKLCAIDNLNYLKSARIIIVDYLKALLILSKKYPDIFNFLLEQKFEYLAGFFYAQHYICSFYNGNLIPGVFNNEQRLRSIKTKSIEKLYESLQKLNRICIDCSRIIELPSKKRLLVDNLNTLVGAQAQKDRQLLVQCLSI